MNILKKVNHRSGCFSMSDCVTVHVSDGEEESPVSLQPSAPETLFFHGQRTQQEAGPQQQGGE